MARRDCDGAYNERREAVSVGKRLGAVDAHVSPPKGHSHGTIIVRANVPHAVAVCDTRSIGLRHKAQPGRCLGSSYEGRELRGQRRRSRTRPGAAPPAQPYGESDSAPLASSRGGRGGRKGGVSVMAA